MLPGAGDANISTLVPGVYQCPSNSGRCDGVRIHACPLVESAVPNDTENSLITGKWAGGAGLLGCILWTGTSTGEANVISVANGKSISFSFILLPPLIFALNVYEKRKTLPAR